MTCRVVTLCYGNSEILRRSFENYYAHASGEMEHLVVDNHYPLNYEEVRATIHELKETYDFRLLDYGWNLEGFGMSYERLIEFLQWDDDDAFITFEYDSFVLDWGFDVALRDFFNRFRDEFYGYFLRSYRPFAESRMRRKDFGNYFEFPVNDIFNRGYQTLCLGVRAFKKLRRMQAADYVRFLNKQDTHNDPIGLVCADYREDWFRLKEYLDPEYLYYKNFFITEQLRDSKWISFADYLETEPRPNLSAVEMLRAMEVRYEAC